MSSFVSSFRRHPANSIVKAALVLFLLVTMFVGAYRQGVNHAIASAKPELAGDNFIVIDYDGQLHEYTID